MARPQPRIGVVTYPGSQDDRDALWAFGALDADAAESESPIGCYAAALALLVLERDGEVTSNVATVGYRSAFIGAVLSTLVGAIVFPTSPPTISLPT